MSMRRTTRASQPQTPVGIDWSNPISRGLVWAFNGSQAKLPLVGVPGFTDTGTIGESPGVNGAGVSARGGPFNNRREVSSPQCSAGSFTVFSVCEDSGTRSAARNPFDSDNNATTQQRVFQLGLTAANLPTMIGFNTAGGPFIATGAASNSAAGVTSLAGVVEPTSVRVYLNGNLSANQGKGAGAMNVPLSTNKLSVAGGFFGNPFGGVVLQALVFNRALSDAEIQALSANPWQIFAPIRKPIFIGASTTVSTPVLTVGRPANDTAAGAWTPSTGGTLSGAIDESAYDDADYISVASLSTCELQLNDTVFPGGSSQVLSYRAQSTTGNGLTVTLKQGATTIASWSHGLTSTLTTYTQTLTAPQIASIVAGPISVTLTST